MENNSIQIIVVTISVITLLGSIYFCLQKLRTIESLQTQTQKHLMYQQNIIEKHNNILKTLSISHDAGLGSPTLVTNASPAPTTSSSFDIPVLNSPSFSSEAPSPSTPAPSTETPVHSAGVGANASGNVNPMNNILPMLSTIMGMMNQDQTDGYSDSDDEDYNDQKETMVHEIEKELSELKKEEVEPISKTEKGEGRVEGHEGVAINVTSA